MKLINLLNCGVLTMTFCLNGLPISAMADILMYSVGPHNGNLGGRAGADALCASQQPSGYKHAHAFLSVKETDEIRDMPAKYQIPSDEPIFGTSGVQLANNWNELLTGSLDTSLDAAVAGMKGASWWSGSTAAGALNSENCSGWSTTDADIQYGRVGLGDQASSWWIDFDLVLPACQVSSGLFTLSFLGMSTSIEVKLNVLCVAYNLKNPGDIPPSSEPPTAESPLSDSSIPKSLSSDPPIRLPPPTTGKSDLKVFRNGVEIVPTEAMLQGNFEDSSLPCGTTYHYELKVASATGMLTLLAKDITTAACPTPVIYQTTPSTPYSRSDWPVFVEVDGDGTGSGTVRSNIGIACHTTDCVQIFDEREGPEAVCNPDFCQEMVDTNTTVILTPEPDPGSVFSSWGGHPDCVDGEITVTGGKLCIAYFHTVHQLSVNTLGNGTIRSYTLGHQPLAIQCDTNENHCTDSFSFGTWLVLEAIPESNAQFKEWTGDCQGSQPEIVIQVTQDSNCVARFE
jgi:hypothetical protein